MQAQQQTKKRQLSHHGPKRLLPRSKYRSQVHSEVQEETTRQVGQGVLPRNHNSKHTRLTAVFPTPFTSIPNLLTL